EAHDSATKLLSGPLGGGREEIAAATTASSEQAALPDGVPALSLRNVNFYYGESERPALKDVSFDVRQGEFVAVVGPSGSGKSTFIKLLGKLVEPQDGDILMFDRPIDAMAVEEIRSVQAVVTQSPMLITGTI